MARTTESFFFKKKKKNSVEEIFYIAFRIIYSNFALFFKGYLGFFTACLKAKKQLFYNMPSLCRREWQPTPIFLPGESHRQGSLAGYSPWGQQESDTTEPLNNNNAESSFSNYSSGRWKAVGQSQHPSLSLSLSVSLSLGLGTGSGGCRGSPGSGSTVRRRAASGEGQPGGSKVNAPGPIRCDLQ